LKGGGHITEIEGQKATQAIARLRTAQSEEGFMKALDDLEAVVQRGLQNAYAKAGQQPPATSGSGGGLSPGEYDFDPTTGQLVPR
jgi:hypothetical protein